MLNLIVIANSSRGYQRIGKRGQISPQKKLFNYEILISVQIFDCVKMYNILYKTKNGCERC
jgi:hypothetical protein